MWCCEVMFGQIKVMKREEVGKVMKCERAEVCC